MDLLLNNVTRRYGQTVAIDQACLETAPTTAALVLIGPSGGGKSTLLRLIGGLETPDSGQVSHSGKTLSGDEDELRQFRQQNGFLFQSFNLFPHLTALDNVILPLTAVHGKTPEQAHEVALQTLDRFGLKPHREKHPAQLSGGQQQRVALARAMAPGPGLLLLDEPTSALDPEMKSEVLDVINALKSEGQRIVLSTHEMGFARKIGDEVAFLAAGKILAAARGESFFADPPTPEICEFLNKVMKW